MVQDVNLNVCVWPVKSRGERSVCIIKNLGQSKSS